MIKRLNFLVKTIEAGAIAFLYDIDDSEIDHRVYPKDLVEYARHQKALNASPSGI